MTAELGGQIETCDPDQLRPMDIPEILAVAGRTAPARIRIVTGVIRRLDAVHSATTVKRSGL